MNKTETEYDLRPEFDLKSLLASKVGSERRSYGNLIRLEPDVALKFPDSEAVNEALRYLIELGKCPSLLS